MTAYREVWIECDGCDGPFGWGGGYRTQRVVVAAARDFGWAERREVMPVVVVPAHLCPDCRDKP